MSMAVRIFDAARKTFGKQTYSLWAIVSDEYEKTLWYWNDAYGPLNAQQRQLAEQHIIMLLHRSFGQANPIAYFRYTMQKAKTDEDVGNMMKTFRDSQSDGVALPDEMFGKIGE